MSEEKAVESCPERSNRALILGGSGMLGWEVVEGMKAAGFEVEAPPSSVADIKNPDSIRSTFAKVKGPHLVINCAAYTAVDKAESEPEAAFAVNRDGPSNLADECRELGIPLIHISTDYVFNGRSERPYIEDDPADPINVYGMSKWEGEEAVRARLTEHIIVRTSWLYGVRGSNFVKTILRLARERETLRIVSDQHGGPTWTRDLSACIVRIADRILTGQKSVPWGTYHFCNRGIITWFDFAQAIVDRVRQREQLKVSEIEPVPTSSYPTPASRPRWSVLDCRKIEETFGISPPDWDTSLTLMLEELSRLDKCPCTSSGKP